MPPRGRKGGGDGGGGSEEGASAAEKNEAFSSETQSFDGLGGWAGLGEGLTGVSYHRRSQYKNAGQAKSNKRNEATRRYQISWGLPQFILPLADKSMGLFLDKHGARTFLCILVDCGID